MKLDLRSPYGFAPVKFIPVLDAAQRKLISGREKFLDTMDAIVPQAAFEEKIAPFYPKSGRRGRPPKGIELMLRMYFLQVWYKLADESLERHIYDSYAMRKFMRWIISKRTCRTRRRF